jgi:hypothetical protein
MAGTSNNTTFINPTDSGFPAYLDFTTLRSNAINYLGPITGKYWTDYNVHDPGITTLEVLMYAIMDLGYRVNLPIGSLLATASGSGMAAGGGVGAAPTQDTNFYTAAQAFGCQPTSELDYRKLLMDLDQVRNVWLEPAKRHLNGLYVIYLETEKDSTDFSTAAGWKRYKDQVYSKVRKTMHEFRNLCEDVRDIVFLEKINVGVKADIEILPGNNVSDVYQALVQTLYSFFSPVPSFYTLQQLTAMNISMDTVFEGRPYTGRPSHGFLLDEDMPDRPSGEQSIYRGAVMQAMLAVTGIKTIRSFALLDQHKQPLATDGGKWIFPLGNDALPAFALGASTFRWFQNGQQLSTQLSAYNSTLQMNALHSGKVLYPAGPPSLDAAIPNQTPLNGLTNYYSIQNDYPQVYGIGPGGLPPTVSTLRQSQALQFKGYLLFFDQLLADYLSQLGNIRQLFAMGAPASGSGSTYFGGSLSTVPGLLGSQGLLRFPPPAGGGTGAGGATLMYPVQAKAWEKIIDGKNADPCAPLPAAYIFGSAIERDTALATVTTLFSAAQLAVQTILLNNGQWKYYFTGIPGSFVLISQNSFINQANAIGEAATVSYIGASAANYSLISLGEISSYSFNLVQSGSAYYTYLQSILENPVEYTERRTAFLEHLLARFAESFADYALLEAGFATPATIANNQVSLMQGFLGNWPALSANRGKGYDYRLDGWDSDNVSGLENRFKAYCGIADRRRHYLCNFEIAKLDANFQVCLSLAGEALFACPDALGEKDAGPAAFSLFNSLAGRENYRVVQTVNEGNYFAEVIFHGSLVARSNRRWPDETSALDAIDTIYRMRQLAPAKGDIEISEYQYRFRLLDDQQQDVRTGEAGFVNESEAYADGIRNLGSNLCPNNYPELPVNQFIDVDGFKIYTRQDVLGRGKAKRWSFEVLDEDNSFRFRSQLDFETEKTARDASCQLLHFLTDPRYYVVRKGNGEWYTPVIRVGEIDWAEEDPGWNSDSQARARIPQICQQVRQRLYTLTVTSRPFRWKFHFFLGLPGRGRLLFESIESFETQQASLTAARAFHQAGPDWRWWEEQDEVFLEATLPDEGVLVCRLSFSDGAPWHLESSRDTLPFLLEAKKDIYLLAAGNETAARRSTVPDETSKEGAYVYRLVDKDRVLAHASPATLTRAEAETLRDELIAKARTGYVFLEICLGGDNIKMAASGNFYYQLRCRNDYFSGSGIPVPDDGLVLFESVATYANADLAQAAFQSNYLTILNKAQDAENYGERKYILLSAPQEIKEDDEHTPVVFVPAVTREAIHTAALDLVATLEKAALSYPIRQAGKHHYRFVLGDGPHARWESVKTFPTAAEAHMDFDFFSLLLTFPGNFFIDFDWARCSYRVGIREVLAESTHRFRDVRAAWAAVEKFICVAQSKGGIHLDRRADCGYSFFIACIDHKAIHPCQYESAAQRDQALQALVREAGDFYAGGWLDQADPHHFRLLDGRGHPLARVPRPSPDSDDDDLNRILDIADAIWAGKQPERYGSEIQLVVGEDGDEFAITPVENWQEAKWMKKLTEFATRFPITRDETAQGGYVYRLEIKLPGFEDPLGPAPSPKDCGCPPASDGEQPFCYLAWKSDKIFSTAGGAWTAWLALLPLLAEKENYRSVFGVEPGSYGIELHERKAILARNPQGYPYASMAIQKTERTRECIDAEGLDLVEHILLRPGLSGMEIPACPDTGPCGSLDFGKDPYSFIVTVALPAWPARFRKPENRVLLESIVQREMPAHILARILWLAPSDMCRFEHLYAGWIDALSREARREDGHKLETVCPTFKPADLLEFLFDTSLACLADCTECGDDTVTTSGNADTRQEDEWLDQINRLYCWKDRQCAEKWKKSEERGEAFAEEMVELAQELEVIIEEAIIEAVIVEEAILEEAIIEEAILERRDERPVEEVVLEIVELPEARPLDAKLIRRLQAARRKRYEHSIAEWKQHTGEEALAENAGVFLLDPDPSAKRFESLLKEIMKGVRKNSGKASQRQALAGIVLYIYLDRLSMTPEQEERWDHLRSTVQKARIGIDNSVQFYQLWQPEEMLQLAPDLDTDRIQSLLREIQKEKE